MRCLVGIVSIWGLIMVLEGMPARALASVGLIAFGMATVHAMGIWRFKRGVCDHTQVWCSMCRPVTRPGRLRRI